MAIHRQPRPRILRRNNKNVPNHAVVALYAGKPGAQKTIVPQWSSAIESVSTVGRNIFVSYLKDAHSYVRQFTYTGKHVRDVALPGIGTAGGFYGDPADRITYYSYSGYTTPPTAYAYDVATGTSSVYRKTHTHFDAGQFVTDQVFYTSKDGTRVPMTIAHRKASNSTAATQQYCTRTAVSTSPITPDSRR